MSPLNRVYWRSLDQVADTDEFRRFVVNEFPSSADRMLEPASRRTFLKLMGASMALAGMTACRWPKEEILPFSHRPDGYIPGQPMFYATSMEVGGAAQGLLVTSYDGRPIKIEGNELHPASLGATLPWAQSAVLEMYDPDRSRVPVRSDGPAEAPSTWADADAFVGERLSALAADGGRGLRILSEASDSPSVARLRSALARRLPAARWHEYEPVDRDSEREGTRMVFGAPRRPQAAFDRADLVVSLDDDFLLHHPAALRYARDYTSRRRPDGERVARLYVVESGYSVTGTMADHRAPRRTDEIPAIAARLAAELFLERGLPLPGWAEPLRPVFEQARAGHAEVPFDLGGELLAHRGASLVTVGPRQPATVHALACLLNHALGNVGSTVTYTAAPDPDRPSHVESLRVLCEEIASGAVDTLFVIGGNPVFNAPVDLDFGSRLRSVPASIHLGLYRDETARACTWHLPRAHFLEAWGDARAWDGTVSVVQPLIAPLYDGRSVIELLATIAGESPARGYEIVRRTLKDSGLAADDDAWRRALHDGVIAGSASAAASAAPRPPATAELAEGLVAALVPGEGHELVFLPDNRMLDGRFANSGWLQELPDALTKLTWDNAALFAPSTARELGLSHGELLRVTHGDRTVELPAFLVPGQAVGSVGVWLGFGRAAAGRVGNGVGVDVYALRTAESRGRADVRLEPLGRQYPMATTQDHWAIDDLGAAERERRVPTLVRELGLAEYRHGGDGDEAEGHEPGPVELWKPFEYEGHRWAMAIDLNTCTGCNACIVACQAENNIPVVGKDEVSRGREMHWLRVDRYFSGDPDEPETVHQPVPCQQCENAPCEQVCPVAATVHDREGLNVMVYNRCVGTRYCANNCPFKVRRFNYFNNHKTESSTSVETMVYNPEVSLRSRGVMEKCSFCLQRINAVKIRAKNDQRPIRDGEITPACAQACPTRAITFGDLSDESSRVAALHEDRRAYSMLEEIHVKPRVRYLTRIRNRSAGAAAESGSADEAEG